MRNQRKLNEMKAERNGSRVIANGEALRSLAWALNKLADEADLGRIVTDEETRGYFAAVEGAEGTAWDLDVTLRLRSIEAPKPRSPHYRGLSFRSLHPATFGKAEGGSLVAQLF